MGPVLSEPALGFVAHMGQGPDPLMGNPRGYLYKLKEKRGAHNLQRYSCSLSLSLQPNLSLSLSLSAFSLSPIENRRRTLPRFHPRLGE